MRGSPWLDPSWMEPARARRRRPYLAMAGPAIIAVIAAAAVLGVRGAMDRTITLTWGATP